MEYVQPYIGSVSKAKEFANDFLAKRNQLLHAEVDYTRNRFLKERFHFSSFNFSRIWIMIV